MKSVTLVIPTFNSSFYLKKILKSKYISFFDEVIISDDSSSEFEYQEIKTISREFLSKFGIKNKVTSNNTNLGGFFNKYNGVNEATNELIYQLDTDNLLTKSTIDYLSEFKFKPDTIYLPGKIFLFKNYKRFNKKINFTKDKIKFDKSLVQDELSGSTKLIYQKNINWVLNVGNQIFLKSNYLEVLNKNKISAQYLQADAYAQSYFWLKNNLNLEVNAVHSHFHRLRKDSYWNSEGENSIRSVEFYKQSILDL